MVRDAASSSLLLCAQLIVVVVVVDVVRTSDGRSEEKGKKATRSKERVCDRPTLVETGRASGVVGEGSEPKQAFGSRQAFLFTLTVCTVPTCHGWARADTSRTPARTYSNSVF